MREYNNKMHPRSLSEMIVEPKRVESYGASLIVWDHEFVKMEILSFMMVHKQAHMDL